MLLITKMVIWDNASPIVSLLYVTKLNFVVNICSIYYIQGLPWLQDTTGKYFNFFLFKVITSSHSHSRGTEMEIGDFLTMTFIYSG